MAGQQEGGDSFYHEIPAPHVPRNAKPISVQIMLGKDASRPRREHPEILQAKTHLKMAGKNLSSVTVPDHKDPSKNILHGQSP